MRTIYLLIFQLCLTVCASAQVTVDTEQFVAIFAKSARLEPLQEKVAVFLTEREDGERTGAFLSIKSTSKWATPYIDNDDVSITAIAKIPGSWLMFAKPGKYKITIIEFDPERGPNFSKIEVTIKGSIVVPPPPPPEGNFTAITKAAKDNADRLNDPPTRVALKSAYTITVPLLAGKTYDECKMLVTAARFGAFNARTGTSRDVNWESWKLAVDVELIKVVSPGETEKYIQAILAIISGLN